MQNNLYLWNCECAIAIMQSYYNLSSEFATNAFGEISMTAQGGEVDVES